MFLWLQRTEPHDVNMYLSKVKYDHADRSEPSVVGTRALLFATATIFVSVAAPLICCSLFTSIQLKPLKAVI